MKQSSYVTRKYPWKSCITRCCRFSIFSSWFQRLWSGSADSMKFDGFRFLRAFTVRSSNVRFFVHGDSPIMLSLPYLSKAPCAKSFSSAYYSQSLLCSNSLPSWWHGSESTSSSSRDRWHPGTVAHHPFRSNAYAAPMALNSVRSSLYLLPTLSTIGRVHHPIPINLFWTGSHFVSDVRQCCP